MRRIRRRGAGAVVAGGIGLALVLTACSSNDEGGGESTGGDDGDSTASSIDCAPYEEFGDLEGTSVSIYTSIVEPEQQTQEDSYDPFEECTGVTIEYEGSREFEAQLLVRIQA
ncbi:MAG TPA: carbohydrate ABC transporter substrate-binding protein, partial [Cellulomonas sp.]